MMLRRFSSTVLTLQLLADLAITMVAVKGAEQVRLHISTGLERRGDVFAALQPHVYLLVLGVWLLFFLMLGGLDVRHRSSLAADIGHLWFSVTVAFLVLASLFYLLALNPPQAPSRLFYLYFYILDVAALTIAHLVVYQTLGALRRRGRHLRRVLLVGAGVLGRHVAVRLRGKQTSGATLVGYLSDSRDDFVAGLDRLGSTLDLLSAVKEHRVHEVVVALPAEAHADVLRMTDALSDIDVNIRVLPDVFEMVAMKATVEDFYGLPLISIREPSINPVQARVKRAFDVIVAALLLIVTSPLFLMAAIWVRLDSPGPIFFHQCRVGAGGTPFYMHKFRSMIWQPEAPESNGSKHPNDPRVTPVGRVLRRTSLDELPQLWNVLVGEMSLVGPRPELPAIVELYEPWQRKRLAVPPGMTGWWQVNGRAERSMHQNTEIDLYYVQNYSILLDVQILLRTLGAVIRGRGAF